MDHPRLLARWRLEERSWLRRLPGRPMLLAALPAVRMVTLVEVDMGAIDMAGEEEEDPMEVTERIHRIKKVGRARALMSDYFQVKSLVSFLEWVGYHTDIPGGMVAVVEESL